MTLHGTPDGVLLEAGLRNLPAGPHAFHIHAVGICSPSFEAAGGHFNPTNEAHDLLASSGPHAGDFPNIHVPQSGNLDFEAYNSRLELNGELFDADGAAIVIHRGADDYRTDPAGNAGTRIACGVISR